MVSCKWLRCIGNWKKKPKGTNYDNRIFCVGTFLPAFGFNMRFLFTSLILLFLFLFLFRVSLVIVFTMTFSFVNGCEHVMGDSSSEISIGQRLWTITPKKENIAPTIMVAVAEMWVLCVSQWKSHFVRLTMVQWEYACTKSLKTYINNTVLVFYLILRCTPN